MNTETEFREGDLVEARKGKTVIVGDLRPAVGSFWIGETGHTTHSTQRDGFTLTLIERPEPKVELPTDPGLYSDKDGDAWRLDRHGDWELLENDWGVRKAEDYAPFTRLESRADTARAVIDWFHKVNWGDQDGIQVIDLARRTFGATDA